MKTTAPLLALALLVGCAAGDADGDGFGASVDCDDDNPLIFPGAMERCDGVDNDCNGQADDSYSAEAVVFFLDEDGDGYGTTKASQMSCADIAPAGFVADASDCDDTDRDVNPGAEELCNLTDDNCNRAIDDNPVDAPMWFADNDEDGFGSRTLNRRACEAPPGWIRDGGDCNDFDFLVNPNALEYCDGFDNDCDDETDEPDAEDHKVWYLDSDGDGHGDEKYSVDACYQPDGYSPFDDDCNDIPEEGGADQTPGVEEICQDGIDNNCNESPDQCSFLVWAADTSEFYVEGTSSSGYLGYGLDTAGDIDGDGIDDMIWGEYRATRDASYAGAGVLVYGEEDGVRTETELDASELPSWYPDSTYDYMGRVVSHIGDIDRDGFDDVAIGAYSYDAEYSSSGMVTIVYGDATRYEDGINIEEEEVPSIVGYGSSHYLGSGIGPAGDLNGDGYVDMLAGGYYYSHDGNTGAGAVWVVPGAATRYGFEQSVEPFAKYVGGERYTYLAYFGATLDAGDLDGDGQSDIVIQGRGYNSYSGGVFGIYGSGSAPSGTQVITDAADFTYQGASSSSYFGQYSTQIPGDLNDDGYDDLVVGQYQANSYAGAVYVFFGEADELGGGDSGDADVTINGSGSSTYLGYGRTAMGDFDNDGQNELAVGAYRQSTGGQNYNGGIYLYTVDADFGTTTTEYDLADAVHTIDGPTSTYAYMGWHVASGEFNGDGFDDLMSGAYGNNGYKGTGYVWFGNSI